MNTRSSRAWRVGPTLNPPSNAISFGRIPSRSSSAIVSGSSVSSPGLPILVGAGRISPRAPRRVCSVTSAICATYPISIEFRDRVGQQRVLSGVADPRRRGEDQPARATAGVLGDLRDLRHVPKLVRLAQLPLADRPGVGIGQRHDPVLDRQAGNALLDLPADFLAAVSAGRPELRLRATATRVA